MSNDYKHTEYAARGIAEYWMIDPEEQQTTVYQWLDGQYEDRVYTGETRIESTVISGFELTVEQIFAFAQNYRSYAVEKKEWMR